MRRAFTVVEVLVVAVLGSIVLVVLWTVFSRLSNQDARAGGRQQGLQSILLLVEHLETDLARVASGENTAGKPVLVTISADKRTLEASVFALEKGRLKIPLELVPLRYTFVPDRSIVLRKEGATEVPIRSALFHEVQFEHSARAAPPRNRLITYSLETVPEALLALPRAERQSPDRMQVIGSIELTGAGARQRYPEWNSIPQARPVEK